MTEEPAHGTISRYRRPWKCRCHECRAANSEVSRRYRAGLRGEELYAGLLTEPRSTPRKHVPSRGCYNRGCREEECVEANRVYAREWGKAKRRGLTTKQLREQDLDLDQYLW